VEEDLLLPLKTSHYLHLSFSLPSQITHLSPLFITKDQLCRYLAHKAPKSGPDVSIAKPASALARQSGRSASNKTWYCSAGHATRVFDISILYETMLSQLSPIPARQAKNASSRSMRKRFLLPGTEHRTSYRNEHILSTTKFHMYKPPDIGQQKKEGRKVEEKFKHLVNQCAPVTCA
jgi:hypothetical protein